MSRASSVDMIVFRDANTFHASDDQANALPEPSCLERAQPAIPVDMAVGPSHAAALPS